MTDAESRVRAAWKRVEYCETGLTPAGPCYVTISLEDHPTAGSVIFMKHGIGKETVFSAALAFTLQKAKEISDVREEIAWLSDGMAVSGDPEPIGDRIMNREQAALDALLRGWKGK